MNADELRAHHCHPCSGEESLIQGEALKTLLKAVPNWHHESTPPSIWREYHFKDFHQTIAFVTALAWIANREDHHPDLEVGYNRCKVHYSTHSIGGLSQNDFICAAKIDALIEEKA